MSPTITSLCYVIVFLQLQRTNAYPLDINRLIDPIQQSEFGAMEDNIRKVKSVFNVPVLATTPIPRCPSGTQRISADGECVAIATRVHTEEVFLFNALKNYYSSPEKIPQTPRPTFGHGHSNRPHRRRPTRTTTTTMATFELESSTMDIQPDVSTLPSEFNRESPTSNPGPISEPPSPPDINSEVQTDFPEFVTTSASKPVHDSAKAQEYPFANPTTIPPSEEFASLFAGEPAVTVTDSDSNEEAGVTNSQYNPPTHPPPPALISVDSATDAEDNGAVVTYSGRGQGQDEDTTTNPLPTIEFEYTENETIPPDNGVQNAEKMEATTTTTQSTTPISISMTIPPSYGNPVWIWNMNRQTYFEVTTPQYSDLEFMQKWTTPKYPSSRYYSRNFKK